MHDDILSGSQRMVLFIFKKDRRTEMITPEERERLEKNLKALAEKWPEKIITDSGKGCLYPEVICCRERCFLDDSRRLPWFLPLVAEALGGVIWIEPGRDYLEWNPHWGTNEPYSEYSEARMYDSRLSALIAAFNGWAEHHLNQKG